MFKSTYRIYIGFALVMLMLLVWHYSDFEFLDSFRHQWNDILILILGIQNIITTHLISSNTNKQLFPIYVIASFVFRLITAVSLIFLMWFLGVEDINTLAINLLILYLAFLAFELYGLLTTLRPNSGQS
jgi:hypothetical protein